MEKAFEKLTSEERLALHDMTPAQYRHSGILNRMDDEGFDSLTSTGILDWIDTLAPNDPDYDQVPRLAKVAERMASAGV